MPFSPTTESQALAQAIARAPRGRRLATSCALSDSRVVESREHTSKRRFRSPAGMTLVELLVVVMILVLLAGVVVPMLQPVLEGREVREASRQLNTFLAKAQAMATQRGRPVGVLIRQSGSDGVIGSMELAIAESPPPYAGDTIDSIARVSNVQATGSKWSSATVTLTPSPSQLERLVQVDDQIKLNYRGPYYRITQVSGGQLTIEPPVGSAAPHLPISLEGVPFQIYRQPRRAGMSSLQLSPPAAIDLNLCGIGASHSFNLGDDDSLIIAFDPNGGIDTVYKVGNGQTVSTHPLEPVHLFIGRVDRIGTGGNSNLADGTNLWCTINSQTGQITTSNNVHGASSVANGRSLARQSLNAGGR